jgi:hypothetical protein
MFMFISGSRDSPLGIQRQLLFLSSCNCHANSYKSEKVFRFSRSYQTVFSRQGDSRRPSTCSGGMSVCGDIPPQDPGAWSRESECVDVQFPASLAFLPGLVPDEVA